MRKKKHTSESVDVEAAGIENLAICHAARLVEHMSYYCGFQSVVCEDLAEKLLNYHMLFYKAVLEEVRREVEMREQFAARNGTKATKAKRNSKKLRKRL